MNQTYFLHRLVNDRDKVVPPGKSVLSMLMHANFQLQDHSQSHLVERVKEAAHKAFWREATKVLSSSMPFVQLPRLKKLYADVREALVPLFPPSHRILETLAAPPPPTSSPLLSTIYVLKDILIALRERCAPIRDQQVDGLLTSISFPPATSQLPITDMPTPNSSELQILPLAQFVIDNIKAILSLAEDMKSDLNTFILGSMTEEQLMDVLSTEVKSRERTFVLDLWGGKDKVQARWLSWLAQTSRQSQVFNHNWIDSLLKALEADKPVFCVPPNLPNTLKNGTGDDLATNNLPPQLLFITPTLVSLQNYIQSIIITAALHILARPPLSHNVISSVTSSTTDRPDFVQRVWSLLKAEIDADSVNTPSIDGISSSITANKLPETKLINLADEVVQAREMLLSPGSLHTDEVKRLREAVDRTLRTSDPVFLVLRKRLLDDLESRLLAAFGTWHKGGSGNPLDKSLTPKVASSNKVALPNRMQTGRNVSGLVTGAVGKGSLPNGQGASAGLRIEVQGFEHDVLRDAIGDVFLKLAQCIAWTESVWGVDLTLDIEQLPSHARP